MEIRRMRKAEANKLMAAQFAQWSERTREPGVLPSVPVVCISLLTGDKQGITMNFASTLPLTDLARVLKSALEQVQAKVEEQSNGKNGLTGVEEKE